MGRMVSCDEGLPLCGFYDIEKLLHGMRRKEGGVVTITIPGGGGTIATFSPFSGPRPDTVEDSIRRLTKVVERLLAK